MSQMTDIDPQSVPLEEAASGIASNKQLETVPLTFKGKNFSILNMPNLTRLREQLSNNPSKLKELLRRCQKTEAEKGRIE